MREVYLTSKENYSRINEKDDKFPSGNGWNPNVIACGTYQGKPLFFTNKEFEESLLRDIKKTEEVEVVRI